MIRIDRWKVQQRMKRAKIKTFGELAEQLEVSPQTISSWFRGSGFSSEALEKMCRVLNCTPNDVLTIEDDPEPVPNQMAPVAELEPA